MDRTTKIVLASCVLFVGVLAAFVFRRPHEQIELPKPEMSKQLVLLERIDPVNSALVPRRPMVTSRIDQRSEHEQPKTSHPSATILTPMKSGDPPPILARRYPRQGDSTTAGWGRPIGLPTSGDAVKKSAGRTHKIVDGDTLARLAKRYLGSSDRQMEIFTANRNILSNPDVLPIGTVLKIPSKRPTETATPKKTTQGRLVPLLPADPHPSNR